MKPRGVEVRLDIPGDIHYTSIENPGREERELERRLNCGVSW